MVGDKGSLFPKKKKQTTFNPDGDLPLLNRNMRSNRSTDPHVTRGPRALQPRGSHRC